MFRKLFGKSKVEINSREEFWEWFMTKERKFHVILANGLAVQDDFLNPLTKAAEQLGEGYWFLAGMDNNDTAELIITADGIVKNIPAVEDLVASAPKIPGWKFTALKPELNVEDVSIAMNGYTFSAETIRFSENIDPDYPDEIDITFTHPDYSKANHDVIGNGIFIFLDHLLGELVSATLLDQISIASPTDAADEQIPVEKLKSYLLWREKEFVGKYDGIRHNIENDNYIAMESKTQSGFPVTAIANADLLNWDRRISHPWILEVSIDYEGDESGMPNPITWENLEIFEELMNSTLKDSDGYLNIGRKTGENKRMIFVACNDFRKASRTMSLMSEEWSEKLNVSFDIFKDKYWRSMDQFRTE